MILAQIAETAKLHEIAAEQGFGVYMLVFFCTVLMYVIVTLWKKVERLNEQLLEKYKEDRKIDENMALILQNLNNKNYDKIEEQIRYLSQRKEGVQ
jgi:hypothetical protein